MNTCRRSAPAFCGRRRAILVDALFITLYFVERGVPGVLRDDEEVTPHFEDSNFSAAASPGSSFPRRH